MFTTHAVQCPVCADFQCGRIDAQPEDYEYRTSTQRDFAIHQCFGCESQFVWPRPTKEELIAFYPKDYHAYNEDHGWLAGLLVARRDQKRQQLYLELTNERPIRLFDVGCGDCRQFDALRDSGKFLFGGVEINPAMAEKGRRQGYDVHAGTLEEFEVAPYAGNYDVVTMYQLVEHVLEPNVLFEKAMSLLKPNGVILGQLPCLDSIEATVFGKHWAGYHFPRHLQQFSRQSLNACIRRAGFVDVQVTTALHLQAAISLQNVIVDSFSPRRRLRFGKVGYYSLLLLAVAPFCIYEFLRERGGMMNFYARRPKRGDES